jgi:hypothetical protein
MFLLPMGLTILAAGLWEVSSRLFHGWALRAVLTLPVGFFLWFTGHEFLTADRREDVKPLFRRWELERTNGEPIYVFAGAIPAWAFYSTDWHAPDRRRLRYLERIGSSTGPAFENASHWSSGLDVQELRYVSSRGTELYGAPTGIEVHPFGLRKAVPDSGWADSEAKRIHGAADTAGVWLLLAHFYGPEGQLLDALQANGAYETIREDRNAAALFHYRFR